MYHMVFGIIAAVSSTVSAIANITLFILVWKWYIK